MKALETPAASDPDLPFHITQRGNPHVDVFIAPEDRTVYLPLMRHQLTDAEVSRCQSWPFA